MACDYKQQHSPQHQTDCNLLECVSISASISVVALHIPPPTPLVSQVTCWTKTSKHDGSRFLFGDRSGELLEPPPHGLTPENGSLTLVFLVGGETQQVGGLQ